MWVVRLNVVMLRRGLRIGSQHLLSVRGRKSGEVSSSCPPRSAVRFSESFYSRSEVAPASSVLPTLMSLWLRLIAIRYFASTRTRAILRG